MPVFATDFKPAFRQFVEPLFAPISISAAGDNIVVPFVPGLFIRLIRYELSCNGPVIITWKSSIAGAISGPMSFSATGGISTPECPGGIMQTAIGESLVINLNGAVSVGGSLTYELVNI